MKNNKIIESHSNFTFMAPMIKASSGCPQKLNNGPLRYNPDQAPYSSNCSCSMVHSFIVFMAHFYPTFSFAFVVGRCRLRSVNFPIDKKHNISNTVQIKNTVHYCRDHQGLSTIRNRNLHIYSLKLKVWTEIRASSIINDNWIINQLAPWFCERN